MANTAKIDICANSDARVIVMALAAAAAMTGRTTARAARTARRFRQNISDKKRTDSDKYGRDFHLFGQGCERQNKRLAARHDNLQTLIGSKNGLRPIHFGVGVIAM